MDDRIFIDEYSVGDGGYELGETIDDVQYVDNLDHSADFLNPPYLNDMTALKKAYEILQERFKNFAEELQTTGYLAGNRLVKAINDAYYGAEKTETLYGDKQGFLFIDGKAFDYTFTGSEGLIEKMEPAKPVYDISWIRKRMKCCKNPMERKQLEKQLNAAYKVRKKARNKK